MNKKQSGKKIYSKPEEQWLLRDIPEETRKLVKGYAQERGEKLGVCVDKLLKEAIGLNKIRNAVTISEYAAHHTLAPEDNSKRERIEEHFKKEWLQISKKPWWRFWG